MGKRKGAHDMMDAAMESIKRLRLSEAILAEGPSPKRGEPFSTFVPGICCEHGWVTVRRSPVTQACRRCSATCVRDSRGYIVEYDARIKTEE